MRRQLRKNQLACLLLAQGVPLMLAGDEVGNTQNGNNNAYCQDNETGWVGWEDLGREGDDLTDFVGHMTAIAAALSADPLAALARRPARRRLLRRAVADAGGRRNEGSRLEFPGRPLSRLCAGAEEPGQAPIFIVLNAAPEEIAFKLPKMPEYKSWRQVLEHHRRQAERRATSPPAPTAKAPPRAVLAFAGSA